MRKNRLAVAILLVMVMLLGIMTTAFAADYTPVDPDDQRKTGIVGGDTLTFTEDTVWANLTARWGVRVIFRDGDEWNNVELQNELLPVTDSEKANTTAPEDPSHEGWEFTGWERVDTNNGPSTLNDDGTVTGINGPGPIIYQAAYDSIPLAVGNLTVSKTISGNAASTTKEFTFTVTLSDTSISGEFGEMTFTDGVATFTLKGGESVTAEGLPAGINYTVVESDNSGYRVTKTGDTGEIVSGETATAAFTNTKTSGGSSGGNDPSPVPVLNTTDHFAYIIGRNNVGGYLSRGQTVNPEAPITRAETVTIFFRMLTDESRDELWSTTNSFTDVKESDWYNNAISTMANGGIITGYPDGRFDPNGNITRAEFAAMAIRFFQDAEVGPSKFSDTIGHWAEEAINKAQTQGLIQGYPDGSFQPDEPITRAEAMTLMNRVLERHPHKDHLLPVPDMITWPDNMDTGKWYYAEVQEATNSHTYHAPDATHDYERWIEELPVRDWAAFERMWSDSHSATNPGNVIDNR